MITLRDYQLKVIEQIEAAIAQGVRRILLVSPTGSGKTVVFSEIIRRYDAQLKSSLVIAHRREIISQTSQKLHDNGVRHGIIQAGFSPRPLERTQVASIATLHVRAMRSTAMALPSADLIIIDEAHHVVASTYTKLLAKYPDAIVIGATATPCRGDGRGLGGMFDMIIEAPQVAELIKLEHLVPSIIYAPVNPDLIGVGTRTGDYIESQLADRMDRPKLIGDIVTHWHKFSERRKTVAFAVNVAHSLHLRDEFIKSGVKAEHIDGSTPKDERDETLKRLASGEIEVVTNCMVLTEGWDCPEAGCEILARPTKKMGLYRQMIGRVLRPAPDKKNAIILDHSGAVFRHGLPEDHVEWTLAQDRLAEAPEHTHRKGVADNGERKGLLECSKCSAMRVGGQPCPCCGFLPQRPPKPVAIVHGDLGLVSSGSAKANEYGPAERAKWHAMFVHIGIQRGWSPKYPARAYLEKFGQWPAWGAAPTPLPPSPEVLSWVRSRLIAYAKRKGAA